MLVNRIGDIALLIGISLIFILFGSLKYNIIFPIVFYTYMNKIIFLMICFNILTLICLFLFIGAMGKSAQLGLHV